MPPIARLKFTEKFCTQAEIIETEPKTRTESVRNSTARDPSIMKPLTEAYTATVEAAVQKTTFKTKRRLGGLKTINREALNIRITRINASKAITGIAASFDFKMAPGELFKITLFELRFMSFGKKLLRN